MPEELENQTHESLGTAQADAPGQPAAAHDGPGMNFPVLVLLLVVLAFVTISNVWLRKRAKNDPVDRNRA